MIRNEADVGLNGAVPIRARVAVGGGDGLPDMDSVDWPTAPPTLDDLQRIEELGRKYDTEYPPVLAW